MREWWGHLITEWRLSVRGAYLWILLFVGASYAWLINSVNQSWTSLGYYIHQFEFLFVGALAILAILSGVYGARRDRKVDQLLGSMPYSSVKRWSAKIIVFAIPFALFTLAPVIIYLAVQQTKMPDASLYPALFLLSTMIPMLYAVILGWLLGGLLRSRFGYFIGFVLFFLHIYGALLFIMPNLPPSAKLLPNFLLLDYKSMGYYDDLWGFSKDISFWLHRGFYLFLAAALFFLFVFAVSGKRKEPGTRGKRAIGSLCLLVAAGFLSGHIVMRQGYTELVREGLRGPVMAGDRPVQSESVLLAPGKPIIDYELNIEPYGRGEVRIEAVIKNIAAMETNNSRASFILNPLFEVEKATADGASLSFQRNENKINIELPDQLHEGSQIELVYSGTIKDYYKTEGGMTPIHEAGRWKVNLPADYEWYPQAEDIQYRPGSVIVAYPEGIELVSNFDVAERSAREGRQVVRFESRDSRGFNLWGGALKELTVSSDSYYTKAIINELVDADYAQKQVQIFHSASMMIDELYRPKGLNKAATLLMVDWIQSKSRDIGLSEAGYYPVSGYVFNGLYSEDRAASTMIDALVQSTGLFTAPLGPGNDTIFNEALTAYLFKQLDWDDYAVPDSPSSQALVEPLVAYIRKHGQEANERLLRGLYKELSRDPATIPDINGLLKGAE